ncbi:hypothetical protein KAJ27_21490, partial [bacterium]|nr:hypothetical protein [bacterium]
MIGITIGDPAGIGLETLKKSMLQLSDEGINFQNNFMFIGPDKIWKMNGITDVNTFWAESKCDESEKIIPGMPTKRSG